MSDQYLQSDASTPKGELNIVYQNVEQQQAEYQKIDVLQPVNISDRKEEKMGFVQNEFKEASFSQQYKPIDNQNLQQYSEQTKTTSDQNLQEQQEQAKTTSQQNLEGVQQQTDTTQQNFKAIQEQPKSVSTTNLQEQQQQKYKWNPYKNLRAPYERWFILSFALVLVSFTFLLASLLTPVWFSLDAMDQTHGIQRHRVNGLTWKWVFQQEKDKGGCESDTDYLIEILGTGTLQNCDQIKTILDAGNAYSILSAISALFLILWTCKLLSLIQGYDFLYPITGYVFPPCALIFHALALSVYLGLLDIEINKDDCEDAWGNGQVKFYCSEDGPKIAITTFLFIWVSTVIFSVIYWRRPGFKYERE